jgi:signal transduction histidine kinase
VPEGNQLGVVQTQNALPNLAAKRALLERMRALLTQSRLIAGCSAGAAALPEVQLRQQVGASPEQLQARNYNERAQVTAPARIPAKWVAPGPLADPAAASTLVPIWLDDPAHGDCLVFARRVLVGGRPAYQGMLADWGELSASLLAAITDPAIAAGARLVRLPQPAATQLSHQLTVLPAALEAPPPPWVDPGWTPGRTLLAAAWIALLAGGIAVALTLAATLRFADRRARFASAVTHELRTPLTTFRMYSEMLAKGMVADEARRQHYLATLQTESDRLARLVENVLGYARIEDGRFTARVEAIDLGSLVARVRPVLERRAAEAGVELAIAVRAPAARLEVDCDAVGQILFNLVDNACKYGKPPLSLTAELAGRHAVLALRDHGPGIPARYRARIFAAFDRGARPMGDNEVPGVGLGLALARELARDLGGDLVLADGGPGARFAVTLPLAG